MSKRPRRDAAAAANKRLTTECTVAEVVGVHASKAIALTSQDVLETAAERDAVYRGQQTAVITLHQDARPKGLPRGTKHIGAAFDDNAQFDDGELTRHLDEMCAKTEAAGTPRLVFVCQAGVNRSSLALCYYCVKHGSASWQQAKAAIIRAKGGAAAGWPTLANQAFEAYLERCCSTSAGEGAAKTEAYGRWFWRTVATARPSTGGLDPAEAKARRREQEERMRAEGINPKTGKTYGCWANGRQGGRWIRGVPNEKRPWPP